MYHNNAKSGKFILHALVRNRMVEFHMSVISNNAFKINEIIHEIQCDKIPIMFFVSYILNHLNDEDVEGFFSPLLRK